MPGARDSPSSFKEKLPDKTRPSRRNAVLPWVATEVGRPAARPHARAARLGEAPGPLLLAGRAGPSDPRSAQRPLCPHGPRGGDLGQQVQLFRRRRSRDQLLYHLCQDRVRRRRRPESPTSLAGCLHERHSSSVAHGGLAHERRNARLHSTGAYRCGSCQARRWRANGRWCDSQHGRAS